MINTRENCKICGSGNLSLFSEKDAKSKNTLDILFCRHCSLVQQRFIPDDNELKIYYAHHYRSDYKKTYRPRIKHVYRAGIAAINRVCTIRENIPQGERMTLLDIGAGGGELVYIAGLNGFDACGIEPNIGYSEYARQEYGVDIACTMLNEWQGNGADIITLFHVLEHMAEPEQIIEKIYHSLNENGYLVIEVPNILQNDASPHNIFFKSHLYYYSRDTLHMVVSKYFEPVMINDKGNLFGIFKKKATPSTAMTFPSESAVSFAVSRLKRKGWGEYLFAGGGVLKPFRRLARIYRERRHAGYSARALLDHLNGV